MKLLLLAFFFLLSFNCYSQVIQDTTRVSFDTTAINSIKLSLDKYNKVRQRAWTLAVTSGICGVIAISTSANNSDVSMYMADAAALLGLVSFFTFNHADKYMRKISLELSPGKLRINF